MSKMSDLHIEQQESGESHSLEEEKAKAKVELYCREFAKVGEKRSLSELATGIKDYEMNISYSLFISIYDNLLGDLLFDAKLNQQSLIESGLVSDYDKGGKS